MYGTDYLQIVYIINGTDYLQIVYIVNANSVNMFKNKIDKYLRRAGYRVEKFLDYQ